MRRTLRVITPARHLLFSEASTGDCARLLFGLVQRTPLSLSAARRNCSLRSTFYFAEYMQCR